MQNSAITIAVVGHTNAGKTSLLRTLTRDKHFGDVSYRNASTRHVEATTISIANQPVLRLYDTPGFEDSVAFRDHLRQFENYQRGQRATLEAFLASPEAKARYEQQAKVVRLLLGDIDAVYYVIDATETPLPKHRAELEILSWCARPVMPVLNFVQSPDNRTEAWFAVLADCGLHLKITFDAVAPKIGSERLLYERLAVMLDSHGERLRELNQALQAEALGRLQAGLRAVAELLIDAAAYRTQVPAESGPDIERTTQLVHTRVREREQACVAALLAIYRFDRSDFVDSDLPVMSARLEDDLFNPQVLKEASQRLGFGAAVGAAFGLAGDLALGGLSLGSGAIIGSTLGGAFGGMLVSSARNLWNWGRAKYHGLVDLTVDNATLAVLLARQLQLLQTLLGRGHAATEAATVTGNAEFKEQWAAVKKPLADARAYPEWSAIGLEIGAATPQQTERQEFIKALADTLWQTWGEPLIRN